MIPAKAQNYSIVKDIEMVEMTGKELYSLKNDEGP
jgi:hypothetical protein